MTYISQRHTARFKKLKQSLKQPNKKEWQSKRDKDFEIKYQLNNLELGRRRKWYFWIEWPERKMRSLFKWYNVSAKH